MKDKISSDLKDAMRTGDVKKRDALRLVMAAMKQIEVDERIELDDTRVLLILDKLVKQRKESIYQFTAAGRLDLVEQEEFELSIINPYLPTPLTDDEILALIDAAIVKVNAEKMNDMGKVMAELKTPMQGRADMSKVSALIKARLCQA